MNYYKMFNKEVIEIIKDTLTEEQFYGFLMGNELKYRLRAGFKTKDYDEDMKKALHYFELRKLYFGEGNE